MFFTSDGNKAEVVKQDLLPQFGNSRLTIEAIAEYVNPQNIEDLIQEGDTVLLAVPARKVAPGAEDIEIPTAFGTPGAEAAIDPRWEALRSLQTGNDAD